MTVTEKEREGVIDLRYTQPLADLERVKMLAGYHQAGPGALKDEWAGKARDVGFDIAAAQGMSRTERKIAGSAQNSGGMIASGGQPEGEKVGGVKGGATGVAENQPVVSRRRR